MATTFSFTDSNSKNAALKKRIIQFLILSGSSSIAEISKEMELSVPTVTKLIADLLDDGYLLDSGKQNTCGGRKPNIYGLNPESGYFIGVDVRRKEVLMAVINFDGKIVNESEPIPYTLVNTPEALGELCGIIKAYMASLPMARNRVLQVGINLSGRINSQSGCSFSHFDFAEQPLSKSIETCLGIPVTLENDSRAMAYGEYMSGAVMHEKDVLFINLNWGLGAGIIMDHKLYYGKSGFSGEFGHVSAFDNEIICRCGKKGCLETEASGYAIQRILRERYKQGSSTILADKLKDDGQISLTDFVDAVLKEDILSIEILELVGHNLGRWIAGLINIFNPELVILGGPLSQTNDYLRLPIKSAIRKYSLNIVNQDTDIILSKLGDRAGLLGACYISRGKLLGML